VTFHAPFACPVFTVHFETAANAVPRLRVNENVTALKEVSGPLKLIPGSWCREERRLTVCFALSKGESKLQLG
jgi:hypothetical protein